MIIILCYIITNNIDSPISAEMNEQPAEILDIIDKTINNSIVTKGGLEIPINQIKDIPRAILKPVTKEGKDTLNRYVKYYETGTYGVLRKYKPVTTLEVDSPHPGTGGGKRNKSKKPKRRNSRSKRRKTVSKRRR
jgi:hypothetical protein